MNSYSCNRKEGVNKIQSKDKFENLKSDYLLQILFNNIQKRRLLDIIKYNKKIQKRLNININDYKEYSETFSSIEIEIIPANNKYDKFIYINNKEEEKYYHIFFDNVKEELKRNYLKENEKIKIIKIIIDHQVKSFKYLFVNCYCIESINFKKFFRNNINDMSYMFYGCSSLKELNISNFNTNNVTNMIRMFFDCSSLKELNVSNFNIDNVTNMDQMFYGCSSLKDLELFNFNTDRKISIFGMFLRCSDELQMKIKAKYKNIKKQAFILGI